MAQARGFWADRKAAVAAEVEAENRAQQVALETQTEHELAGLSDDEVLNKLDLPEPDTLPSAEAVQTFLKSAAPQRLKQRALRRLWRLNPILANVDGLVEYGEDYTDAATVVENLQTVYEVGRGMLARFEDVADTADDPENEAALKEVALVREDGATSDPVTTTEPSEAPALAASAPGAIQTDALAEPEPVSARRMRFSFDEADLT